MTLADLLDRLQKATGPDRELDAAIGNLLLPRHGGWFRHYGPGAACAWTASVDAAIALAERVLPGWRICTEHGDNYSIAQFKRGWGARCEVLGLATTERADDEIALCLSAAILSALQAKEKQP